MRRQHAIEKCAPVAQRELGPDQQDDAAESDEEPEHAARRQPVGFRHEPLDSDHPERHRGNQDRGQAARQRLLGPDDAAVPKPDEKHAEHGQRRPVRARRDGLPADFERREDNRAGNRPSESRHEERRNRLDGDSNSEVGRSPQQAHGHPGKIGGPFGGGRQIAILRCWISQILTS